MGWYLFLSNKMLTHKYSKTFSRQCCHILRFNFINMNVISHCLFMKSSKGICMNILALLRNTSYCCWPFVKQHIDSRIYQSLILNLIKIEHGQISEKKFDHVWNDEWFSAQIIRWNLFSGTDFIHRERDLDFGQRWKKGLCQLLWLQYLPDPERTIHIWEKFV